MIEPRHIPPRELAFDLPFPPSLNTMYPTFNGRRVTSEAYKEWQFDAGKYLMTVRNRFMSGQVEISLTFSEQSRKMDLDNRIKPVLDLLVKNSIIEGDHNRVVRKITAQWGDACGVHVEIKPAPQWVCRRKAEG